MRLFAKFDATILSCDAAELNVLTRMEIGRIAKTMIFWYHVRMKRKRGKTKKPESGGITKRILFIADFSYSSAKQIVSGVVSRLSSRPDVALVVRNAHPADADWGHAIERDIDGVISCIGSEDPFLRKIISGRRPTPAVFVSVWCGETARRRRTPVFTCDDAEIGRAAAALLLRHDLTEFGFVGARMRMYPSEGDWARMRRDAFVAAVAEHGFKAAIYEPRPVEEGAAADDAALAAWLKALPKPCGLFACYDQRAMHVLGVCRANGIAVPEQIQVVGVDNESWICEKTIPTLTSIEPDFEGAGWRAAEALLALMEPKAKCKIENVKCKIENETFGIRRIVQRMSTTDAYGHAGRAVRARDHIAAHAAERVTVASVAKKLCCSTRTLEISFKKVFGITVSEEIAAVKVAEAKKLISADTPLDNIPELVGYESPRHFKRIFKARMGITMSQWRKQPNGN